MYSKINDIIEKGETVQVEARQVRYVPGGALLWPNMIHVTNKRVIIRAYKPLGLGVDTESYGFKNITSVKLIEGVFSSSVHIFMKGFTELSKGVNENGVINGLGKHDAFKVYRVLRAELDEGKE